MILATQYAPIPYTAVVIGLFIALTLATLASLLLGLWARRGDLRGGR